MSDAFPAELLYTKDHEWARVEGKAATIGITKFAVDQLGDITMVELPKEKSATGRHEMFSLFVTAGGVQVSINGKGVAGRPVPRDMAGKQTSTAFLAFSETWVRR